ncbi:MetS family NSS transporter small subunit [uncultured Cetobacterium sp.]|nr:MetS family NSS transporter small subunit [uncultured Cetobacterium sp.]
MNTSAIIMWVLIGTILWGGFAFCLRVALASKEKK